MQMRPLDIREGVNIEHHFSMIETESGLDVLVVGFRGQSGYGCANNDDAIYMSAMIAAGLVSWSPAALVLDFRQLAYEWGDLMVMPLVAGKNHYAGGEDLPTAVIVSDLNRTGLASLIELEMDADRQKWLYESLEDAVAAVSQ